MIRASARKPVSERSRRSTSGLMSRTATLIARNEPPQMSARVIRAAYGRRRRLESDTGLPLVGREHERDRAVVFDTHPHDCSKAACPGLYSARAKLLHERLVELLGASRVACLQQARPAAPLAGGGPAGEDRVLTRASGRVLTLGRVYPGRHPAIHSNRLPTSRAPPGGGSAGEGRSPHPRLSRFSDRSAARR